GAGHLGAAEAARALHLDALRPGLQRVLDGTLHGPPEGDPGGELVGDALRDEGGVELGLLDLLDVELDLGVAGDLGQPAPEAVGLAPPAADDDAGARGVDVDAQPVPGALDLDPADGRVRQLGHQVVPDLPVLDDVVRVLVAIGEPAGLPLGRDAEPEAVGVDLLPHDSALLLLVGLGVGRPALVGRRVGLLGLVGRGGVLLGRLGGLLGLVRAALAGLLGLGRHLLAAAAGHPGPARLTPAAAGRALAGARGAALGLDPLLHLGRHRAHLDGDVAHPLADAGGAPAGPRAPALEGRALVGVAGRDVEGVAVQLVVVLGVGDRRVEAPGDDLGGGALGEPQHVRGLVHRQAPDEVEDLAGLVGGHADVADPGTGGGPLLRGGGHHRLPRAAFSWPAW